MKRVAIAFNPNAHWLRPILRGVRSYLDRHEAWDLAFLDYPLTIESVDRRTLRDFDGVLYTTPVRGPMPIPAVAIHQKASDDPSPAVLTDLEAAGQMACDHLFQRGLRSLAAIAPSNPADPNMARVAGFQKAAIRAGAPVRILSAPRPTAAWRGHGIERIVAELAKLIGSLPRPSGLFACDTGYAWRALLSCRRAQLRVPEDISLISGGDDEVVFEAVTPSISGTRFNSERIGYLAAEKLSRLMRKDRNTEKITMVAPIGVVERKSTSFLAVDDSELAAVVKFIWANVEEQLKVNDLLKRFPYSDRTLTRRMQRALGHGPAEEIRRSRIETAKRLLITTDDTLASVALRSGYSAQPQLHRQIKDVTGLTPTKLRLLHRSG